MLVAGLLQFGSGIASEAHAQTIGDMKDKPGEVQALRVPKELIPPAPALTPEEALKSFRVAPGFRVEIVAAEPLVEDPIAIEFGPDGRLWVLEMRGYMNSLDGSGEDQPMGRISILRDTDGDGRMDERTTFADGLIMPRALCLVGDGALVGAPPRLQFMRDTDGDGRADRSEDILTNFGLAASTSKIGFAYHAARGPNNPAWTLDNWINFGEFTTRLRYTHGQFQRASSSLHGQYGLTQDDYGRLYFNSNSDYLESDLIAGNYLLRNPNQLKPYGSSVSVAADQLVWSIRVNPGVNRGYREDELRSDGHLRAFTAACGPLIYRGALFPPEFRGNAFVCEPAGNLVRRSILTEKHGVVSASNAYREAEFLASTDERFRPVNLKPGPDGGLYVVDFYRGIIEHRLTITTYLTKQVRERGLDQAIHRGRIYRIVPEGKVRNTTPPQLAKATTLELVSCLTHADGWWRDTAQRLLVEKSDPIAVPALKRLMAEAREPLARLHALWTLDGFGQADESILLSALGDSDSKVRSAAVRLCEPLLRSENKNTVIARLAELSRDPPDDLRLQLVLSLGEAATAQTDAMIVGLIAGSDGGALLVSAAISGLAGREWAVLQDVLPRENWKTPDREMSRLLAELVACVIYERQPAHIVGLLQNIPTATLLQQRALLDGIVHTSTKTRGRPVEIPVCPVSFEAMLRAEDKSIAAQAHEASRLIVWPGKPDVPAKPVVLPLNDVERARFELGRTLYTGICAGCHQPHGRGQPGVAPPLEDSEWVNGPSSRLIRILLHGLYGPIRVAGQNYRLDMPSFGAALDDGQIAAILTYIRREWEHNSTPVSIEAVSVVRAATKDRTAAWIQEELSEVP